MLKSIFQKRNEVFAICILVASVSGIALCYTAYRLSNIPYNTQIMSFGKYLLIAIAVILCISLITWLFKHGVHKGGLKYVFLHNGMINRLRVELQDAGIFVKRFYMNEEVAVLPTIKVSFSKDYMTGEVRIRKTVKDLPKLDEDKDISCGLLDGFIIEQSYVSKDGHWNIYEIFYADYDRQLIFENCQEFRQKCASVGDYDLIIDSITTIALHHTLICGQTGSGKSYAVYGIIYQMLSKNIRYNLYFADPKQSGLAVIGKAIDSTRTADTIDGIIELIRNFHAELEKRKKLMESKLADSKAVEADYKSFQETAEPVVLIFDEMLAFTLSLANYEKKIRDEVTKMLSDIVLMGRQGGVYLFLILQQSPANQLPSFIRDQLVFKCVLGNSDRSTYVTTFDTSADIKTGKLSKGYGVYTYSGITEKPKLLAFPTIRNFNIIDSINKL